MKQIFAVIILSGIIFSPLFSQEQCNVNFTLTTESVDGQNIDVYTSDNALVPDIKFQFDEAWEFSGGMALVEVNGNLGYINLSQCRSN